MNFSLSMVKGLFLLPLVTNFLLAIDGWQLLPNKEKRAIAVAFTEPNSASDVLVKGHVRSPGAIEWRQSLTLTAAIGYVGGFKWRTPSVVTIVRQGERLTCQMAMIIKGQQPDPLLKAGDIIEVPDK